MMRKIKVAVFGCGFWSQFQIGGWLELPGVEITALYNRTLAKAKQRSEMFNIQHYYDNAELLMKNHPEIDVVDIITDVDTHYEFVALAARYGKHVICQKPMAPDYETAKLMMKVTHEAGVKYFVHENYRWQPQFQRVKQLLDSGAIGLPFRCLTAFNTAFPLFETQPFLATLEKFALTDQGSHQFDVLRFLFGEADSVYCQIQQVNPTIKGEDVATSLLRMKSGVVCIQEISFSSPLEKEIFPQTLLIIEGDHGSIRLDADFHIAITASHGTGYETVPMKKYSWQTDRLVPEPPAIVACNNDILQDLLGKSTAQNNGEDNFETVRLVWAAYQSAAIGQRVLLSEF
jgi:predicted dehydrogenase